MRFDKRRQEDDASIGRPRLSGVSYAFDTKKIAQDSISPQGSRARKLPALRGGKGVYGCGNSTV
ncbi:MAG: hypothetical protein D6741_18125 [Planctomycetota bacterium]|nr:MAG: hypothetical protein D6741_18125 [Planctomycetota bacterium]